jgi:hypothetical protein
MATLNPTANVRRITADEFDRFKPTRGPLTTLIGEEREWYASLNGNVIGVLVRDRIDKDWSYAVLGRDQHGKFRAIDFDVSVATEPEARNKLIASMQSFARSRRRVFKQ